MMQRPKLRDRKLIAIKIIGVGGGGSNAVSRMNKDGIKNADLMCVNTDIQALERMDVPTKMRIGERLTRGLGVGGDPNLGRESAEESKEILQKALRGADMVFVAAGMGGGTGTGAAPVVARLAKASGALTVGVVTRPFTFEGARRRKLADEGLKQLSKHVDTLLAISNDRLLEMCDTNVSVMGAFKMVDDVLAQGIRAISDVINVAGEINVDFADVRSIMTDSGKALMSIGEGEGEDRIQEAVEAVLASPLLDTSIEGATGVLFNITGGNDLTLTEVNRAAERITEAVNPDGEKIFGVVNDPKLNGKVRITLIATGLGKDSFSKHLKKEYAISAIESDAVEDEEHEEEKQPTIASLMAQSQEKDSKGLFGFLRKGNHKVKEGTPR